MTKELMRKIQEASQTLTDVRNMLDLSIKGLEHMKNKPQDRYDRFVEDRDKLNKVIDTLCDIHVSNQMRPY